MQNTNQFVSHNENPSRIILILDSVWFINVMSFFPTNLFNRVLNKQIEYFLALPDLPIVIHNRIIINLLCFIGLLCSINMPITINSKAEAIIRRWRRG